MDVLEFLCQVPTDIIPCSEDTLMVFATYLDDHLHRCYATMHHYMAAIHAVHIALGLPSPLENCLHLHQLLLVIHHQHHQPQPDSG